MMDCRVKPGNDENPYMIDAYADLRNAANSGECTGSAARALVEQNASYYSTKARAFCSPRSASRVN